MALRAQVVTIVVAVVLAALVFELVRRKKLREQYSIFWLITCAVMVVVAVWNEVLFSLSSLLGISNAVSLVVLLMIGSIVTYFLHLSIAVSRLTEEVRELVQWVGILRQHLDERQGVISELEEPEQPQDGGAGES